jgi:Platelet-activating factor acetylhydrolase, isoform II
MVLGIFVVFSVITILFTLLYWIISADPFPQPTGQWQFGTSDLIWDTLDQSGLIAKAWYPTDVKNGIRSPYLDRMGPNFSLKIATNLLYRLLFGKFCFGRIPSTPALINAPLSQSQDSFPVILFSPGLISINSLNTFYALEFASHGFIVIGINHPGSSASTMLTDGSQIGIDQEVLDAFVHPDLSVSKITVRQASNISMVLDQVVSLNSDADSFWHQRIDISRIFAAGHSIGGSASFAACGKDRRISKSINLDGFFYIDEISMSCMEKDFFLILSNRTKNAPKEIKSQSKYDLMMAKDKERMEKLSGNTNFNVLLLQLASHVSFSDIPLIINPAFSRTIGLFGGTDGREVLSRTSMIMIDFFNK